MIRTIRGHVLILQHPRLSDLLLVAQNEFLMPFSVSEEGDMFQLSHPLRVEERMEYRWLYEIEAAKLADKEAPKQDEDGPPDDDGPRYA